MLCGVKQGYDLSQRLFYRDVDEVSCNIMNWVYNMCNMFYLDKYAQLYH